MGTRSPAIATNSPRVDALGQQHGGGRRDLGDLHQRDAAARRQALEHAVEPLGMHRVHQHRELHARRGVGRGLAHLEAAHVRGDQQRALLRAHHARRSPRGRRSGCGRAGSGRRRPASCRGWSRRTRGSGASCRAGPARGPARRWPAAAAAGIRATPRARRGWRPSTRAPRGTARRGTAAGRRRGTARTCSHMPPTKVSSPIDDQCRCPVPRRALPDALTAAPPCATAASASAPACRTRAACASS